MTPVPKEEDESIDECEIVSFNPFPLPLPLFFPLFPPETNDNPALIRLVIEFVLDMTGLFECAFRSTGSVGSGDEEEEDNTGECDTGDKTDVEEDKAGEPISDGEGD
ncbi:hypothetical protein FRC18_004412 [Serendipita sp. 400]|nr:hypothetical protein FRC18_004412 [Serendipita sp. 400]